MTDQMSRVSMSPRDRVRATLDHREPDRIPMDFGGTPVTGIHVSVVSALRDHYGLEKRLVKVHEPYQMLGVIDDDLKQTMGVDVEGLIGRETMFGFRNEGWKSFTMPNGLEVLVSNEFTTTVDERGDTLIYPKGNLSAPPSGRMPSTGFFFDTIVRQKPIDWSDLDPADNVEEYEPLAAEDLADLETDLPVIDIWNLLGRGVRV